MKMLRCPICFHVKRTNRKHRTCSPRCAAALRRREEPDLFRAQRVAAGHISAQKAETRRFARWSEKYPGVPLDVLRQVHRAAYSAGRVSARVTYFRRGFDDGYSAGKTDARRGVA